MASRLISDACSMTLIDAEFENDFVQLTKNELGKKREHLTADRIARLLETASLFALNKDDIYQKLAFKIAIYLLNQYKVEYPFLPLAVEIIMTRLGDLPTIRSIVDNQDGKDYFSYFGSQGDDYDTLAAHLKFPEIPTKKLTNQIEVFDQKPLTLTDFQSRIYYLLRERCNVAFSSPTSTGKSYVIHNYIAERLRESNPFCAVYIAPTKALIAEVQASITKTITDFGVKSIEFVILTSSNFLNSEQVRKSSKKVFVLTQERLQEAMANNPLFDVDLLVVDEAHKICDKNRGIIIEDAVQELITKNPAIQKVFISPYIQNPERFKTIFDISDEVISEKTSKSPVGQNIFFVGFRGRKVSISLLSYELKMANGSQLIDLEESVIPSESVPHSHSARKAWVASHLVSEDEPTLIYCDRPSDCRRVAGKIAAGLEKSDPSQELKTAISFFTEHVHEDYYLCDSLRYRIGYHYGKMPQFVRFYVKKLFEDKEINLLCCTSTLLEGVNLPAKNIILYNPKAGEVMDRLSLLNLAGRAGRLLKDYYGKIYCIDMENWERGKDVFEDRLENLESSAEKTLEENADFLIKYLQNPQNQTSENVRGLGVSLIMKQLVDSDSTFLMKFKRRHENISQVNLDIIRVLLAQIVSEISLLKNDVILKNRSIDPRFQYELYQSLRKFGYTLVPSPGESVFYNELLQIFETISKCIFREKDRSYRYYAYLANEWISQESYKSILEGKIRASEKIRKTRETQKEFVNRMIDKLDDDLETKLKYDYTRALKCYIDIVQEVMREKGDNRSICKDLPIFLEAGASSKSVLFLLELGLSRNVAIGVGNLIDKPMNSASECLNWIRANQSRVKDRISRMLYREIEALLDEYEKT